MQQFLRLLLRLGHRFLAIGLRFCSDGLGVLQPSVDLQLFLFCGHPDG